MFVYLALSLLLLVVMAWFILAPFLVPATSSAAARTSSKAPVVLPPKDLAATATPTAKPAAATRTATEPATPARSTEDVRASVEAAIAARKAAMVRHSCDGCGAPVDRGDAFCRACGTRVEEG